MAMKRRKKHEEEQPMNQIYDSLEKALKAAGYEKVGNFINRRDALVNVEADPKQPPRFENQPTEELVVTAEPSFLLDPETKNFATLTVLDRLGLTFRDHTVYGREVVVWGVKARDEGGRMKDESGGDKE